MLKRLKNQFILFVLAMAMLIACFACAAPSPENGILQIFADGELVGEVTIDEMREMKVVTRRLVVHSSKGDEMFDFKGTMLLGIFDSIDPSLAEEYKYINVVGADEYSAYLTMEEVLEENNVYIMFDNGDEPLPKYDGKPGAMRVIVLKDAYGQRFTNYLTRLELVKEI